MADITKSLFQLISEPDPSIMIRPDLFVNDHSFKDGHLIFNTVGYYTKSFTHAFRVYIPFSFTDNVISEFTNGVYEVFPLYKILVLQTPSLSDSKSFSIFGVYAMNTTQFDTVFLDDALNEVPSNKVAEVGAIKRFQPKSMSPTAGMRAFYNSIIDGTANIKFI